MASLSRSGGRSGHFYRIGYRLSFLIIAYVALRKLVVSAGSPALPMAIALLLAFLLLYVLWELSSRRFHGLLLFYLVLQVCIVQALGLARPYEDTWPILYICLGFQVFREYPRRLALLWGGLFSLAILLTLIYTTGLISGLGFGLFYIATGIFFIAYDALYASSEIARLESQELLSELQQAHAKLQEYADQAEELASAQEHDQIVRELHDSVSQIIFSITLTAQSARTLLDKDPARLPEQLDRLQELTGRALSQMRSLISQWRTP